MALKKLSLILCIWITIASHSLFGNVVWEKKEGSFSLSINIDEQSESDLSKITLLLTLTYPENFTPDFSSVTTSLTAPAFVGPAPFSLFNETEKQEKVNELITNKITYVIYPKYPGNHPIVIPLVRFFPKSSENGETIQFFPGIFWVNISTINFKQKIPGSPMPLELTLTPPLSLSPQNRIFQESKQALKQIAKENLFTIQLRSFPWKEMSTFGIFIFLIFFIYLIAKEKKEKANLQLLEARMKKESRELFEKLDTLYLKKKKYHEFFIESLELFRNHLERMNVYQAKRKTTIELTNWLEQTKRFKENDKKALIHLLTIDDKIKFSLRDTHPDDCEKMKVTMKNLLIEDRQ